MTNKKQFDVTELDLTPTEGVEFVYIMLPHGQKIEQASEQIQQVQDGMISRGCQFVLTVIGDDHVPKEVARNVKEQKGETFWLEITEDDEYVKVDHP